MGQYIQYNWERGRNAENAVDGPIKVSMGEWTYTYIVRAMQQIVIRPGGAVEEPVTFSAQADSNDWVRWNW